MRDDILDEEYNEVIYGHGIGFRNGPESWQMANRVEDQMIAGIDCKNEVKKILIGVSDKRITDEFWWLVRLMFSGPKELCDFVKSKYHNVGISKCTIRQLMLRLGFDRRRTESALNKIFWKGVKKDKKIQLEKGIMKTVGKESIMKKETKDRLNTLKVKEMHPIAKEVGYAFTAGTKKVDYAVALHGHIAAFPEDKELSPEAEKWFSVCDILIKGDAKDYDAAVELAEKEMTGTPVPPAEEVAALAAAEKKAEKETEVKATKRKAKKREEGAGGFTKGSKYEFVYKALKKKPRTLEDVCKLMTKEFGEKTGGRNNVRVYLSTIAKRTGEVKIDGDTYGIS